MASVPLRSTVVTDAPKDYSIPAAQQIRLLSVSAVFVDNGAASDWCPAVVIEDNNGNALVRAADKGVTVTAGSDAEVSWFPGVKAAAAATVTSSSVFAQAFLDSIGHGDSAQVVNAGATNNGDFPHASTTDATTISWSTVVHTNDTANLLRAGTYLCYVGSAWDVADVSLTSEVFSSSGFTMPHLPVVPNTSPTFLDFLSTVQDSTVLHATNTSSTVKVLHNNQLGVAHQVNQSYFTVVYLATG